MFQQQHQWGAWCSNSNHGAPSDSLVIFLTAPLIQNWSWSKEKPRLWGSNFHREPPIRPPIRRFFAELWGSELPSLSCGQVGSVDAPTWLAPAVYQPVEIDCSTAVLKSRVLRFVPSDFFFRESGSVKIPFDWLWRFYCSLFMLLPTACFAKTSFDHSPNSKTFNKIHQFLWQWKIYGGSFPSSVQTLKLAGDDLLHWISHSISSEFWKLDRLHGLNLLHYKSPHPI